MSLILGNGDMPARYQPPTRPRDPAYVLAVAWFRALPDSRRLQVIRLAGRRTVDIVAYWMRGGR